MNSLSFVPCMAPDFFPPDWLRILNTIRTVSQTDVFLAGGAVRDHAHDVEVKDLDFWLYVPEEKINEVIDKLTDIFGFPTMEMDTSSTLGNERNVGVIVQYLVGSMPVQVIFLTRKMNIAELLADFDFGLCQAGTDGLHLYATKAAEQDHVNKTLTYMRHGETTVRIAGRLKRLLAKYPTYKPVNVPEEVFDGSSI